ncbi:4468_t:CDS:1, partial [Dentiscutata erythropus]
LCDNIPGTVVIIKVNGSNEILCRYNPLVWTSKGEWLTTTDGFIFSLKSQNLTNSILSRVIYSDGAIRCYNHFGPKFGGDFYMLNDSKVWSYRHNDLRYEKRLRSVRSLLIDEFEVFQVLKN